MRIFLVYRADRNGVFQIGRVADRKIEVQIDRPVEPVYRHPPLVSRGHAHHHAKPPQASQLLAER